MAGSTYIQPTNPGTFRSFHSRAASSSEIRRREINMSRKRAFMAYAPAFTIFLALSATASAQEVVTPKYEVGVSYSYLHVKAASGDLSRNGNGGSGYFEYNLNRMIGLVGDFG